jgi:hypothetical protein
MQDNCDLDDTRKCNLDCSVQEFNPEKAAIENITLSSLT